MVGRFGQLRIRLGFLSLLCGVVLASGAAGLAHGAQARLEENGCLTDVRRSAQALSRSNRSELAAWTNGKVPGRFYTQDPRAAFGFEDHFQGVQRLPDSRYVVVSGGILYTHQAHLFVIDVGSASASPEFTRDFGSNLVGSKRKPPEFDRIVAKIELKDKSRWHAGGISALGSVLAVPFESLNPASSEVRFYDFTDPLAPREIYGARVPRKGGTAAVAIERLPDAHFVLGAYTGAKVDFYRSRTDRLEDGFDNMPFIRWQNPRKGYQRASALQLIRQCDGRYFLVDFDNDTAIRGVLPGRDWMRVYQVSGLENEGVTPFSMELTDVIRLRCDGKCNFAAAAGAYVGSDNQLRVYGTPFFRTFDGKLLPFAEFSAN